MLLSLWYLALDEQQLCGRTLGERDSADSRDVCHLSAGILIFQG